MDRRLTEDEWASRAYPLAEKLGVRLKRRLDVYRPEEGALVAVHHRNRMYVGTVKVLRARTRGNTTLGMQRARWVSMSGRSGRIGRLAFWAMLCTGKDISRTRFYEVEESR